MSSGRRLRGRHVVTPPTPPGAIGWNVYSTGGPESRFLEFIPEESELARVTARMVDDVAAYAQCCGNQPAGPGWECTCALDCACRCAHCACSAHGDNGDPA